MIKIFSQFDSPRLNYIASLILGEILGLKWEIVTDRRKIGKCSVINYSSLAIDDAFTISPSKLLFEENICTQDPKPFKVNGVTALYPAEKTCDFPFDIFAASFFMVTRYEEYLPSPRDAHNRFCAESGIAFKNDFIRKPVVDIWSSMFAVSLLRKFPLTAFKKNKFTSLTTFDVDQPFEFLGKDVIRSIGGLIRDLGNRQGKANDRYRTVRGEINDPFDVFGFINSELSGYNAKAHFFFPVCDRSKFDFNPSWRNEHYVKLINDITSRHNFGLHPSYYSNTDSERIQEESGRLEKITSSAIYSSRFHYLRLELPGSLRALETANITDDYTMGFHDQPGFRAGLSRPFTFFDLQANRKTGITVHPLIVMDVTLYQYLKLSPDEASPVINQLIDETKAVGGTFVSLWHNTSLLENVQWQGWRTLFSAMLKKLQE